MRYRVLALQVLFVARPEPTKQTVPNGTAKTRFFWLKEHGDAVVSLESLGGVNGQVLNLNLN